MPGSIRSQRASATAMAMAALVGLPIAIALVRDHHDERWPFDAWTTGDTVTWTIAAVSVILVASAGSWLSWRLPANPTGWWLSCCAVVLVAWIAGSFWPGPASAWIESTLPPFFEAAAVMAVLPWPVGRLERRWARPLAIALLIYVAVSVTLPFVGFRFSSWAEPDWARPTFGGIGLGVFRESLGVALTSGIAPLVLLAALVRRHAGVPRSMRSTVVPAFAGGALLAITELWFFTSDEFAAPVTVRKLVPTAFSSTRASIEFGRFGLIAALLVVAEAFRRRAADPADDHRVELAHWSPEATPDLARLLGDPTARVVDGPRPATPASNCTTHRIDVVDHAGRIVAGIEHDPDLRLGPNEVDLLVGAAELALIRRARQADHDARTAAVEAAQRHLLHAQDLARHRLERDLHDGAQQRLVALTLDASRLARRTVGRDQDDVNARNQLLKGIDETTALIRSILVDRVPAVVDPGLVAGLHALEATVPIQTTLATAGDLDRGHPAAALLWYIAAEAVANALKHASASHLAMSLRVTRDDAQMVVADDGIGGSTATFASISARFQEVHAIVEVDSAPRAGTAVRVWVDLDSAPSR